MNEVCSFEDYTNTLVDALLRLITELANLIEAKPLYTLGALLFIAIVVFAVAFAALAVLRNVTPKTTKA